MYDRRLRRPARLDRNYLPVQLTGVTDVSVYFDFAITERFGIWNAAWGGEPRAMRILEFGTQTCTSYYAFCIASSDYAAVLHCLSFIQFLRLYTRNGLVSEKTSKGAVCNARKSQY